MGDRWRRLRSNVQKAFGGIVGVLRQPQYIFLAILLAFLISSLIYFAINVNFYWSLLVSLPAFSKLLAIGLLIESMVQSYFQSFSGVLLLVLSLLQGLTLALLVYNFRHHRQTDTKAVASGGLAAIAAVIGLGCVPCGTSILIPIMTLIFSSSAYAFLDTANLIVLVLATLLSVYACYKMGLIVHINRLTKQWKKETNEEND